MDDVEFLNIWNRTDRVWRLIQYLISHGETPKRQEKLHLRVYRYLQAQGDPPSRDTDLKAALAIHRGGQQAELQARLLTGAPFEAIAAKLGMTPTVVGLYHDVFYDVRTRLEVTHWVLSHAIAAESQILSAVDEATIWRHVGWQSPSSLELLIRDSRQLSSMEEHLVAEEIRLRIKFLRTSLMAPEFKGLCRKLSGASRRITSVSGAVPADIQHYLIQLDLAVKENLLAAPRRAKPRFGKMSRHIQELVKQREVRRRERAAADRGSGGGTGGGDDRMCDKGGLSAWR